MAVVFEVDPGSGVPIYVQLVERVRRGVEGGGLSAGDRLPTVRELAGRLGVAPNTVVRAYGELQREGLVESRPGVGTVISASVEGVAREVRVGMVYGRLEEVIRDAIGLGISEDDLWERVDREYERAARGASGPA